MASKPIAAWRWIVTLLGLAFGLGGLLAIYAPMSMDATPGQLVLMGLVTAVFIAVGSWLCLMYWQRIDEAAREAHKWAWYWGGGAAILPLVIAYHFIDSRPALHIPLWPGFSDTPGGYMASGGMYSLAALTLGYLAGWLAWWLWRSR